MKKILFPLLTAVALATGALTSCSSQSANITFNQVNYLLAGNWYIASVDGKNVTPNDENQWPYLHFNTQEGTLSGNIGCNQVMGAFTFTDGGKLRFDNLATTRMMCPDLTIEDAMNKALPLVRSYSVNNVTGTLTLTSEQGTPLIKLMRIDPRTLQNYRQSY